MPLGMSFLRVTALSEEAVVIKRLIGLGCALFHSVKGVYKALHVLAIHFRYPGVVVLMFPVPSLY